MKNVNTMYINDFESTIVFTFRYSFFNITPDDNKMEYSLFHMTEEGG